MRLVGKYWKKMVIGFNLSLALITLLTFIFAVPVSATGRVGNQSDLTENVTSDTVPYEIGINFTTNSEDGGMVATLRILLTLTVISLAPAILIMLTSFTRIIVVLHFVRSALTTQTTPPNQVLIGLALFLTLFIMAPTFTKVNDVAIKPLEAGDITAREAFDEGMKPMREFMLKQTKDKDIKLFLDIAEIDSVSTADDIPSTVLIPAFIISELRAAFIIGFCIYVPFLIIDMVVSSTLMSMGMMMLPPTTISMPFKILLFILVDGWDLIIGELVKTFVR